MWKFLVLSVGAFVCLNAYAQFGSGGFFTALVCYILGGIDAFLTVFSTKPKGGR